MHSAMATWGVLLLGVSLAVLTTVQQLAVLDSTCGDRKHTSASLSLLTIGAFVVLFAPMVGSAVHWLRKSSSGDATVGALVLSLFGFSLVALFALAAMWERMCWGVGW